MWFLSCAIYIHERKYGYDGDCCKATWSQLLTIEYNCGLAPMKLPISGLNLFQQFTPALRLPFDGNDVFLNTPIHFVADLLLLSILHMTVLFQFTIHWDPGLICPYVQNSPGQLTCAYGYGCLCFLSD